MKALIALLFSLSVFAVEGPPPEPKGLNDVFSVAKIPGSGALTYKLEDQTTEKIELGAVSGLYGMGMIFNGAALPEPLKREFANNHILQLALGTLKPAEQGVPQFAAATLFSKAVPTKKTLYRLAVPNSSELKKGNVAVLLFTPPGKSLGAGGDEKEKLRESLFAESGSLIVTPVGTASVFNVSGKGEKIAFYRRNMKIDWAATLTTPFAKVSRSLTGTTEFQFVWPKDKAGEKLAIGMVVDALKGVTFKK